jgi:hypothetical protein
MYMNQFQILAHGQSVDVDALAQSTILRADHVWRRRDYNPDASGKRGPATSGMRIILGNGLELGVEEQDRIATEFLEANREALSQLGRFPGISHFALGLQFRIDVDASVLGACVPVSARLMRIAGEIGMRVAIYIDLNRCDWLEQEAPRTAEK